MIGIATIAIVMNVVALARSVMAAGNLFLMAHKLTALL